MSIKNNECEVLIECEKSLRGICHIVKLKGREILSDFGITIPQFEALQIVLRNKSITISEISDKMGLACSTITDLIDRMEKSSLVARERDTKDRRVVRVVPLSNGEEILEEVLKARREFLGGLLDNIEDSKKQTFLEVLQTMKKSTLT